MQKKRTSYNVLWHDLVGMGLLVVVVSVVFGNVLLREALGFFFTASAPVLQLETTLVTALTFPVKSVFTSLDKQQRLVQLSAEVSRLNALLLDLEHVQKENGELRKLLESSGGKTTRGKIASPLVSLAYPAVAVGELDGVTVGDTVVVSGTLVGIITEVIESQSKVTLLSSRAVPPLLAQTESGAEGIVVGNGRQVQLTQLPRDVAVRVGERVVTTGQEGVEKNMFIGKVVRVEEQDSSPTKTAIIEQLVSFYEALIVEVW